VRQKTISTFNIYIIGETIFIYLFGRNSITSLLFRRIIAVTTGLFFLYCALNIYFNGFFSYPTAPFLLFSVNGMVMFLGLLILQSDKKHLFRHPLFYLNFGMIVFYGCTMPYYCVVNYFARVDQASLIKLFQILVISCYIRYSLTAVAYIVLYRQQKKIKLQAPVTRSN